MFTTYHRICNQINTTGTTSGAGTANPSGAPEFTPGFQWGFVLLDLYFYVYVLQIVVCPFVLFLLAIVLSVLLRYTDSDYLFGIFKLFFLHFSGISSRYYIVVVHANRYYIEFVFVNLYDNIFLDLNRYYIEVVRVKNWYYFDVIHVSVYYIVVKRLHTDLYSRKDMNLGRFNIDCM